MISPVGEYLIQLGSVPLDDGGTAAEAVSLKTEEETGSKWNAEIALYI